MLASGILQLVQPQTANGYRNVSQLLDKHFISRDSNDRVLVIDVGDAAGLRTPNTVIFQPTFSAFP